MQVGGARLGDARRDERLLLMVASASRNPDGRVSRCIPDAAERQGAYDFLEHDGVSPELVIRGVCSGVARLCAKHDVVLVILDGSSLSLKDGTKRKKKGFGDVGARARGGTGLKVVTAYAVTLDGRVLGVLWQEWWARKSAAPKKSKKRSLKKRESHRWHRAAQYATELMKKWAPNTRLHFVVDREGDASLLMRALSGPRSGFTIRGNGTRKVINARKERVGVREHLAQVSPCIRYEVAVPEGPRHRARRAKVEVRFASVPLVMRDRHQHKRSVMETAVVWVREVGYGGKDRLDWFLYTTTPVVDARQALSVVDGYALRWRIEDFHRAWKRGVCDVERTQLRSKGAVIKWATILAVVAARAESLKHAARKTPTAPATEHFTADELKAIVLLKRREKRRNETVGDEVPTTEQAVRWLADLGGYIGPWNGPPGATVISRGLARIESLAAGLQELRDSGELR